MNKDKIAIDYKGKHFSIHDKTYVDDYDIEDPYVDIDRIIDSDTLLTNHVHDCNYYGIPPYVGSDKDLQARIKKIIDAYDTKD